jgi:class 3 adenylate cyclase
MSASTPQTSLPGIYVCYPKQLAELERLSWTKKITIAPVQERYRYEFLSAMVKQNFQRMVGASKFGALIIAALILLIDVMGFRVAAPTFILERATYLHLALFTALALGYIVGSRIGVDSPNRSIFAFFIWANVFRTCYTVIAYALFYTYAQALLIPDISGPFAVFVGLISAGLYANLGYALLLAVSNGVVYTFIVLSISSDAIRASDMLFNGYAILLISVFSSSLLFRSFRQEFAMTKQMQEERKKADELNERLSGANEEIQKQIQILSEQAREIEIANTTLQERGIELEQERERATALLYNILPRAIAERLQSGEEHIAQRFDNVTVMFADIVGFTELSATRPAFEVVSLLNRIFSAFDIFSEQHSLEKIKTIGDAYMIVGGLPEPRNDHAEAVALMALEMITTIRVLEKNMGVPLAVRIGVHSGEAVAGVIGKKKFAYDLWGDTVNIASRMESHGEPGKIHVSETAYHALKERFDFERRGEIEIKGKGAMTTYFLVGVKKSAL